ncbi:methylated-DNA--[protein]-cysteine S-methyltransferase [Arachidicoccus terrestris]|uniref:methylated-DNA--[protein]-cysteine S-methyltransferase n=1 Tax=Arachidicoccus terrestris TaxID=2875539 RepID=UPI001CC55B07|nr:methylated-DNA--[protein]-cysteine S-methyltransferase [Arachidicoccus terrestris]UAY56617.1 methylated-DNA--[protein]-cysteine S-methyltransferase [Arachidicoccus terrestris]
MTVNETSSINVRVLNTPLGCMVAAASNTGLILLEFGSLAQIRKDLNKLATQTDREWAVADHPILQQTASELQAYFSGNLKRFTIPLDPYGNTFAQSVWQTLLRIPYGETWTYKKQAEMMKNPLAIRAIAATNGRNPIAIIIPCHRVIGSNGSLTGYAGGLEKKKWLLQLERSNSPVPSGSLF